MYSALNLVNLYQGFSDSKCLVDLFMCGSVYVLICLCVYVFMGLCVDMFIGLCGDMWIVFFKILISV